MKHKLFLFLVTLTACLNSLHAANGVCGVNLTWYYNEQTNTLTISGSGAMADYASAANVPWHSYRSSITELHISNSATTIGAYAFQNCTNLTSVSLPIDIVSIGDYAFKGCTGLTTINIPSSVTSIGSGAFQSCEKLSSTITIPVGVTSIESSTFQGCKALTSISIPNTVVSIKSLAFARCSGLTSINLPNSIQTLETAAFYYCSGLTSVTIPESVTSCSGGSNSGYSGTFAGCYNITSVVWNAKNCADFSGSSPFYSARTNITSFVIGATVEYIPAKLCYEMSGLSSITLPNSVTNVGQNAFYGCTGLSSPIFNNHVFAYMPSSNFGAYSIPDGIETIGEGAFSNCSSITSIFIPNSVTSIGQSAFLNCSLLTSISIPCNVSSIGTSAFEGCNNLVSVVWNAKNCADIKICPFLEIRTTISSFQFGDSVQHIPSYLCDRMSNLSSIIIPKNVTTIESYAFRNCTGLTSITIPENITSVSRYAFSGCTGVMSIIWKAKNYEDFSSYDSNPFYTIRANVTSFQFGDSVQHIPAYLCNGMTNLSSISIPESVRVIGAYAFCDCSGTTSITIPNGVTDIKVSTFSGCLGLTSIIFPEDVTSIGDYAFSNCTSLTSITIPKEVASIGNHTFSGCSHITSVFWNAKNYADYTSSSPFSSAKTAITSFIFGDSVQHIPAYICDGMSNLTSLTISREVTTIGNNAFSNCSGLTSVTIPEKVTTIGISVFYNCSSLTSIIWDAKNSADFYSSTSPFSSAKTAITSFVFGDSVQHIPSYICDGMSNLTTVTLPEKVTTIGNNAFSNCSGLTSVTIPENVTTIGGSAFSNCSGLTSVTIPENVTTIGGSAFYNCSSLTSVIWNAKRSTDFTSSNSPFSSVKTAITSFVFGDSVQHIPSYICDGMSNLTSLAISDKVTTIGEYAFNGCSGLTSITIPENVASIGNYALRGCTNITTVTWNAKKTGDFAYNSTPFYNSYPSYDIRANIQTFVLGDSVEYIPANLCNGINGITSITIGEKVDSIGYDAFYNCTGLTSVVWNAMNCIKTPNNGPFYTQRANITSFIFGDSVQYIPAYLCCEMSNLTSINIPNSVEIIGNKAFDECSSLTEIILPTNLTTIGERAFQFCTGLTSIVIPDGVTSIDGYVFNRCTNLQTISLPKSLTSIAYGAFASCTGLTSFTIPENIIQLDNAFYGCSNLTSIDWKAKNCSDFSYASSSPFYSIRANISSFILGDSVQSIPAYLCNGMSNLISITIPENVISIGKSAFNNCTGLTAITIPNSVTSIGGSAFSGCTGLTSLSLGNSLTTIGEKAFWDCSGLTSITIPASIKKIERYAFANQINITTVRWNAINCNDFTEESSPFNSSVTTFTFGDSVQHIPAYLCYGNSNPQFNTIVLPNSVKSIGEYAFYYCSGLTSITIPNDVRSIGHAAFYNCNGLESVNLGSNLTSIGELAFYNCNNLPSIVFPDSLISIGYGAFWNCRRLTTINVPDRVTTIGRSAFLSCNSLSSVILGNGVTSLGDEAFCYCISLKSVSLGNSLLSIGNSTFSNCNLLDSIFIPDNVTAIGNHAFSECYGLKYASIGESVQTIGDSAFFNCNKLGSTIIPNNVTSIGTDAFYNVFNIIYDGTATGSPWGAKYAGVLFIDGPLVYTDSTRTNLIACSNEATDTIVLPNSVEVIGASAFSNCYNLTHITIPESVVSIGENAFYSCHNLSSVSIPNNVISIGDNAFYNVPQIIYRGDATGAPWGAKLMNAFVDGYLIYSDSTKTHLIQCLRSATGQVELPAGVITIGNSAFSRCENVSSVIIPDGVISMGDSAFYDCSSMKAITLPNTITRIPFRAFQFCDSLSSIIIPSGVTGIDNYAFSGCIKLASLTLPNSITSIGSYAFRSCESLTSITIPQKVTRIERCAFQSCSNLTTIILPDSVTFIDDLAFYNCPNLVTLICYTETPPSVTSSTFYNLPTSTRVYVPDGSVTTYQTNSIWGQFDIRGLSSVPPTAHSNLNIFASALSATQEDSIATIHYLLNTQATSLEVLLWKNTENINSALSIPVMDPTALSIGAHTININLPQDVGTYKWAIKAASGPTSFGEATLDDDLYRYYSPKDVAVDNNPESPFFGRIYVSESSIGQSYGETPTTQNQTRGLYIYHPDLTFVNGQTAALQGYDGNIGGSNTNGQAFKRIAIDENGYVYVASRDETNNGVYRMNPANPSADFTTILNATASVDALGVWNGNLYTLEGVNNEIGMFNRYSLSSIPVSEPEETQNPLEVLGIANGECDMASDGHGGWWIVENRVSMDNFPCLVHFNNIGVKDYEISRNNNSGLLTKVNNANISRFGVAVNPAGNLLAMGSDGTAVVFSITYDAVTNVPTLTKLCQTSYIGLYINGVAFDYADNLYVVTAVTERFYAFSIAKDNNVCITPAPQNNTFSIRPSTGVLTIAEALASDSASIVTTAGVVTYVRGKTLYMQDSTGGASVYAKSSITCEVGDYIVVTGKNGMYGGAPEISNSLILYSESGHEMPAEKVVTMAELLANPLNYFAQRVNVEGVYIASYDTRGNVSVTNGMDTIQCYYVMPNQETFPVGSRVNLHLIAGYYRKFQFVGPNDGIELAPLPKFVVTFQNENGMTLQTDTLEQGGMPIYQGDIPSKESTLQYRYTFAGWTPNLVEVTEDVIYTAIYDSIVNKYVVMFLNEDSTLLQLDTLAYGAMPIYRGVTPGKQSTAQYSYTFAGWSPAVGVITGDATYLVTFSSTLNKYEVSFADEDGTILQRDTLEYGAMPIYRGVTPGKMASAEFTYYFGGWSPAVTTVSENVTYVASYVSITNKYIVTFRDEDNTLLQRDTLDYGAMPAFRGAEPFKAATAQYTYTFAGWSPAIVSVTGEATYVATYSSTVNKYVVTFLDENESLLQRDTLDYGAMPAYRGAEPFKAATAQYTYTFTGWSPAVAEVTGNVTYTATYESIVNKYIIQFLDDDSTLLQIDTLEYGAMPEFRGTIAYKEAEAFNTYYVFDGWAPEIVPVTEDAVYVATYRSSPTDIPSVPAEPQPQKVLINGKMYIIMPDGTRYSTTGKKVE